MNKLLFSLIILIMVISPHLFPASPTMILGLSINSLLYPYKDEIYNDLFLHTEGIFSNRGKFTDSGYYSIFSAMTAGFTYVDPYIYADEEVISFETGFHFENSKLLFITGFSSSITGTETLVPYYSPDWELTYYFITERKKIHPFISYLGYYYNEPEGNEDIFYQGTEFGITQRPNVTHEYEISIGVGWENWPEYPIYTDSGVVSAEIRNDLLYMGAVKVNGIYNFVLDWEIAVSVLIRSSNANNYIDVIDYVNDKSEDLVSITAETTLEWSPSRYVHLRLHPFFTPEIFLNRQALTPDSALKGENVRAYTAGGDMYIDWTPNNAIYIIFETAGMIYFSNHMDEIDWNTHFQLGLEYSLKL